MKQAQDILKNLITTLNESVDMIEELDGFEQKPDILEAIDSAYNDISYQLHQLS